MDYGLKIIWEYKLLQQFFIYLDVKQFFYKAFKVLFWDNKHFQLQGRQVLPAVILFLPSSTLDIVLFFF